ncbi:hypothetical protein NDU88_005943 [Pleurodeles waltl]|uniref:Uncharacterized protein n=1 Tax=Pleurodeles waltl TaxID=8319 RepID=A0AAV7MBW9_PLEWA|nr:hypothetical protein NDU88_005943 [Pleurodeles waltl]
MGRPRPQRTTWRQEEVLRSERHSPARDTEKRSVRGARGGRGFSAGAPQQIAPGEDPDQGNPGPAPGGRGQCPRAQRQTVACSL